MPYKILTHGAFKDTSTVDLTSDKTSLVVITVNKDTLKDAAFKAIDKASKGFLKKSISSHLKEQGSSLLLPKVNGIEAESILMVKALEADAPLHKWLGSLKSITKQANKIKAKDISLLLSSSLPQGKDIFWMIENTAKAVESNAYIFTETKNKTVKNPTLKKLVIYGNDLTGSNLKKAKDSAKKGFAIGEGVNTAKYLGDLPANNATPKIIEKKVKAMTKDFPSLKIKSFNEKDLAKMGMGS